MTSECHSGVTPVSPGHRLWRDTVTDVTPEAATCHCARRPSCWSWSHPHERPRPCSKHYASHTDSEWCWARECDQAGLVLLG
jgi:hypothetical protein